MRTATGTQKWMSVMTLANVFCLGVISLGMRPFSKRSAAMLGQKRAFIQWGNLADLGRSLKRPY